MAPFGDLEDLAQEGRSPGDRRWRMRIPRAWSIPVAVLLLLSAAVPARAGDRAYQVTAEGGISFSKLRDLNDPLGVYQDVKSFTGGLRFGWPMGKRLEIQSGVLYIVKGVSYGKSALTDFSGNSSGEIESMHVVNAVEVPVLVRWGIPLDWRVRPVLLGGPFVSFETAERFKVTGDESYATDSQILKNTDYGIVLGTALEMKAGPGRWILEGRYDLGLADLGDFDFSGSVHSGAFAITMGYAI
jgi:hypothetical protein